MEQWEYKVVYIWHRGWAEVAQNNRCVAEMDLEETLNGLGAEGWEIVCFPDDVFHKALDGWALFKRKKAK